MKNIKILSNILFWITLISPMAAFALASVVGEVNIFGIVGVVRYSWVMLFFIPLGVLSILIGNKLKENNLSYKKNYIIAFICVPLLIIFGSYRFIFSSSISYDVERITAIEKETNLELPNQIKIATNLFDSYNLSYAKIIDTESKVIFENELETNLLWKRELSPDIKALLPLNIQYESVNFDYFVFYDLTNDTYNTYATDGEYKYIFIAYDYELKRFVILDNLANNL